MIFGFSDIDAAFNLWDRFRARSTFFKGRSESAPARFVRLFESHGVHRNQIPRFFGYGLTLKDLQDDASLIAKLDEDILEAACKIFAVRREWLDGASAQAHPEHDFYKHPADFLVFINELKAANPEGQLHGTLFVPDKPSREDEAILVLYEIIGFVGDEPIYRYHLCDNWQYTYWKSRAYLIACVALAWKHKVYVRGTFAPKKIINKLAQGETLLGNQKEGVPDLGDGKWYAEDMALLPEVFLKDIDPENNDFGIKAGLDLWLALEEQGFMDVGVEGKKRSLFMQELEKYS